MNYQVLARKYRPQRFDEVIGQQHATVTLMNALTVGRVAHGYIFSGHRGIGKTTVARILAMALNCRHPIGVPIRPNAEPCGQCESCTEIRAGNSVDVIEIDAATNRGIDEIRELRDAARYRPARDRFKIYILDEAHQITDAAFNALLKTLEEPPEHIVFMMATTQPEDIPQTVRSRCQHFSFRAVRFTELVAELRSIAAREQIEAPDTVLQVLAEAGDGSVRDALSVMDQAIASAFADAAGRTVLDVTQIRDMLGSLSGVVFERLLEAVRDGRTADLMTTANELIDSGNSPVQIARQMVRFIRNSLLAKISGIGADVEESSDLMQISVDEQRRAARSAAWFSEEDLTRFLQMMLRTFDEMNYRQEPRLHLELGLMKLVQMRRLLPVEQLLSQIPVSDTQASATIVRTTPQSVTGRAAAASGERPPHDSLAPSVRAARPVEVSPPVPAEALRKATPAAEGKSSSQSPGDLPTATGEARGGDAGAAVTPDTSAGHAAAGELRVEVVQALRDVKGQSSASDALADAAWSLAGGVVRIQTMLSPRMLEMVVSKDARSILRRVLARSGEHALQFELLPAPDGVTQMPASQKPALPKSGSAESRAQRHPVVQEAQRLFNAEIRNVIDLSNAK